MLLSNLGLFYDGIPLNMRNSNIRKPKNKTRPQIRATAARHGSMAVKVAVDFPAPLYRETERAVRELSMNRSHLIRHAVERFLVDLHKERLEKELAAGYQANDRQISRSAEEFAYLESDLT